MRYWWRLLADIAYATYWSARKRELRHFGIEESGVFSVKEAA